MHNNSAYIPLTASPCTTLAATVPLLRKIQPILATRVTTAEKPPWMDDRTYQELLSLPDDTLVELERRPHIAPSSTLIVPNFLRTLHQLAEPLVAVFPCLHAPPQIKTLSLSRSARRSRARLRSSKQVQIATIASLVNTLQQKISTPATRIVDMGAGHGHLCAHLATHLDPAISIVAVDRDENLLSTARGLHTPISSLAFAQCDIGTSNGPQIVREGDFVVGLHACGELGDAVVSHAARRKAMAVLLVSCCLQKIRRSLHARHPLSETASKSYLRDLLTIPRDILGATNSTRGYDRKSDLTARETRHALRLFLNENGYNIVRVGDELEGISRHAMKTGLRPVISHAASVLGSKELLLNDDLIRRCEKEAKREYRLMRALTLPRATAAAFLEMAIILDRAAVLEEAGFQVATFRIWADEVSARNLCIAAWKL